MSNKIEFHDLVLEVLKDLKKKYPNQGLGRHISDALSDYPNYWGLSDKELLFALQKYVLELEENNPPPEKELQQLIDESSTIDKLMDGIDEYGEEEDENGD